MGDDAAMSASPSASVIEVDDPGLIERFARRDTALHLYELGDLDPFFWPHTRWWGLADAHGELSAVALLYSGASLPTLLALGRAGDESLAALVTALAPRLPERIYSHLGPGLLPCLGARWKPTHHGRHLKMELVGATAPSHPLADEAVQLGPGDREEILALYERAYPGNWFDARMLESGQYFGLRRDGVLASVAGIHVFSPRYRVAALGNVTTDPRHRGQGLAAAVTARLCRSLRDAGIETIGLNVLADNAAAIACYRGLGFAEIGEYDEHMLDPA
jgi:ribosomal protein S18 acetylase RimI-like enzyme